MTRRLAWLAITIFCAAGCGGPPAGSDAGSDAAIDAAPACRSDGDCDDGLVCNGTETCHAGHCATGTPMHCDDSVQCTTDTCSELLARCVFRVPDTDGDGDGAATCVDGTGTPLGTDCDDHDPRRFHGAIELCDAAHVDEDCDPATLGGRDDDADGFVSTLCCDDTTCGDDCDDTRAAVHVGATEVCNGLDDDCDGHVDEGVSVMGFVDHDRDGYGDPTMPTMACGTSVGFSVDGTDCDDVHASVHPGQVELCDGIDNDCDASTAVDANAQSVPWYRDADGDGFGDPARTTTSCMPPAGYALLGTDCDDTDPGRNPASAELCNGIDDDCNGVADYVIAPGDTEDDDRDAVPDANCHDPRASDCDDHDPTALPGAIESCDGRDNDCDGRIDENATQVAFYRDADHDGFGSSAAVSVGCTAPTGYARRGGDCDDTDDARFPGAIEPCNGVDDDCDTAVDEGSYASATCAEPHALDACVAGRCQRVGCATGFGDCAASIQGCETSIASDAANCGGCMHACPGTNVCTNGACVLECTPGSTCTPNFCEWTNACSAAASCGVITDCRPIRIDAYAIADTALRGPGATVDFTEECPTGMLPYGIEARVADATGDYALSELALLCGTPQLSATPITLAPSSRQPSANGDPCCSAAVGATTQALCPNGMVISGFSGTADGAIVRTLSLECTPLVITGTDRAASFALQLGASQPGTAVGTMPGTPFAPASCAAGTIAQSMHGAADASGTLLAGFGLGCGPPSLAVATSAPIAGYTGGSQVPYDCPIGTVPIEMTVSSSTVGSFYHGYLTEMTFQCAYLTVVSDGSGGWTTSAPAASSIRVPATYTIGGYAFVNGPTVLACPTDEVIVGFAGIAGYQIAMRCAHVNVTGDPASGFVVSYGAVDQTPTAGFAGGTPYGPFDCPPGTVGSGFFAQSGEVMDGVALRCARPTISPVMLPPS